MWVLSRLYRIIIINIVGCCFCSQETQAGVTVACLQLLLRRKDQWTTSAALGVEPTATEVTDALRTMSSINAVGSDQLPAELLKSGLGENFTVLFRLHRIIVELGRGG